tara:strand:- start:63 stop:314 length:252 start_codon:yes stop_codon:yes gene_type:complete
MKRFFLIALTSGLITLLTENKSNAYPKAEKDSCVTEAIKSIYSKGVSANIENVERYCDCALKKIIDEKKDIKLSIEECNDTHF